MTLDEAIKHCEEKAEDLTIKSNELYRENYEESLRCHECASEHERLAEWLRELRGLRLLVNWAVDCDFGYDNIPDLYERYADEIKDMGYTEGLVYIATKQANQVEPLVQRSEEE